MDATQIETPAAPEPQSNAIEGAMAEADPQEQSPLFSSDRASSAIPCDGLESKDHEPSEVPDTSSTQDTGAEPLPVDAPGGAADIDTPSPLHESSTEPAPTDALDSRPDSTGNVSGETASAPRNHRSVRFSAYNQEHDHVADLQPTGHATETGESGYSKQRTSTADDTIGATQVHERAPNINLRFFRGLAARTASQRTRNRDRRARLRTRQRQQQGDSNESRVGEEMLASVRPMSNIMLEEQARSQATSRRFGNSLVSSLSVSRYFNHSSGSKDSVLINATLVEEEELEYAVAEEMSWWQEHARVLLPCLCVLLIALAGSVTAAVVVVQKRADTPSEMPSLMPSLAPSQDLRDTIVNVQERGILRCGLINGDSPELKFRREFCRAIAAVVLGDPDKYEGIDPWAAGYDRWNGIQRGLIDVQITGDTHTVQREVEQELTFSTPYYYDGASYNGNATFVQCAYEQKRYGECENLVICVLGEMPKNYIARHFSPEFYLEAGNWEEVFDNYKNGTCNVFSGDRLAATAQLGAANLTGNHVIDNLTFTNEPLALVTRNDESEWSDIVNWVLQALFYGEREGLVRDESLCDKNMPTNNVAKLNFLNAVYCIGNYKEIYAREFGSNPRNDINHINYGTPMLYVTPFGTIYDENAKNLTPHVADSIMVEFYDRGLHCGVVIQRGCEDGNMTAANNICGMGVDMCVALAASIKNGNPQEVVFTRFGDETSALRGLANQTVDVLVGLNATLENDFRGVSFSMPYFYGNETSEVVYSVATRDDEATFASYVNSIVLATVYAVNEGITQEHAADMPTITLFGTHYLWALKDAISAKGNYDEIYARNFDEVADEDRGRNALNELQTPMLFNNPGLSLD